MLRLKLATESFWVDCPHGVRLLCRPLTNALNEAAINRAARAIAARRTAAPDDEALNDPDLLAGMRQAEALSGLGTILIEAWEGVGDAEGEAAAPVTPDNIRALLTLPELARAFNEGISRPLAMLAAEGNA